MSSRTSTVRRVLRGVAVAALALAGSSAPGRSATRAGSSTITMKQDLADREKDIHWPEGFDPSRADLFSHNALVINVRAHLMKASCIAATTFGWRH